MTSRVVTLAGFAVLVLCAAGLEVLARWSGRLCTLGEALGVALRNRGVSVLLRAGWLWLGWHLFVRVDQP